ncbi:MAG: class I tRNA ligase family protein, partial [Candidatus Caldarchaeum sp.]
MAFKPVIDEKAWRPSLEKEIYKTWEEADIYRFNSKSRKKKFIVDTPPPYPSGRPWHIGAASQYSQIDMIARTARMTGYMTLFPIGIDRNGLPVEMYTEKKYGIS